MPVACDRAVRRVLLVALVVDKVLLFYKQPNDDATPPARPEELPGPLLCVVRACGAAVACRLEPGENQRQHGVGGGRAIRTPLTLRWQCHLHLRR